MARTEWSFEKIPLVRRAVLLLTLAPAVFLADFFTKQLIQNTMVPYGDTIKIISGLAKFRFIYNEGIAFGLQPGLFSGKLLIAVSLAVTLTLIWYILFSGFSNLTGLVGLCMITGGACGNLYDRIVYGQVVDFIEIGIRELTWPVFNVADIAVTCGAVLLALRVFFQAPGESEPGRVENPSGEAGPPPAVHSGGER